MAETTCRDCRHWSAIEGFDFGLCVYPVPYWVAPPDRLLYDDEYDCPTFVGREDTYGDAKERERNRAIENRIEEELDH